MKKSLTKSILISLCMVLFLSLSSVPSYASALDGPKFISPKLKITSSGIKFDNGEESNGFKKATDEGGAINAVLAEYRHLITVGSGIASLTLIAVFIFNFMRLGNSKGNPAERNKAIMGLVFAGIATALTGSVTLFTSLFYNFVS